MRKLASLTGRRLAARDGEIGKLEEVYFDDREWTVRYFVVRAGGWLRGRHVLIPPRAVRGLGQDGHCIDIDLSREQIEGSPPIDVAKPVSRHYEEQLFRHYAWPPYWVGMPSDGFVPARPPTPEAVRFEQEAAERPPAEPHLRSSSEVTGYYIRARDGTIGHVVDLVVTTPDWRVAYVEIDTRNWWPGRKVLVPISRIHEISWAEREAHVDATRDELREAPAYEP